MNVAIVTQPDSAILCDPAFTLAEIARQREHAVGTAHPRRLSVLVTHADFDHVCGLGLFPDASVLGAFDTKARLEDGSVVADLLAARREWREAWPAELRIDAVLEADEPTSSDGIVFVPLTAHHHGREGLTYVLPDDRVLLTANTCLTCPIRSCLGASIS